MSSKRFRVYFADSDHAPVDPEFERIIVQSNGRVKWTGLRKVGCFADSPFEKFLFDGFLSLESVYSGAYVNHLAIGCQSV